MTALPGFPLGTIYQITGISKGMPGVVTISSVALPYSFAIAVGQTVTISGVVGMTEVNDNRYIVASLDLIAQTFQLYDLKYKPVSTLGYETYISGGEVNIISYPPGAGQPPGLMYNNQ